VLDDVDAVLQAVSLERHGEPLPGLDDSGAGGWGLAEDVLHMGGWIERGTSRLAVDVGLAPLLVLDFCGKAAGDRMSVARKPLIGVAVRGVQASELQLNALDIRLVMVDLVIQLGRGRKQALALRALAPPERLGLCGELAGVRGLLVGALAVLVELVLEPQSARRGPGIERLERRSAGGDRLLELVGSDTRGTLARVIKGCFDCSRAELAERDAVTARHSWRWGVLAADESEALLRALDSRDRALVVAARKRVLGRRAERLGAGDPVVEAIAGDRGDCVVVGPARRGLPRGLAQ
jgi:hypothetical protein